MTSFAKPYVFQPTLLRHSVKDIAISRSTIIVVAEAIAGPPGNSAAPNVLPPRSAIPVPLVLANCTNYTVRDPCIISGHALVNQSVNVEAPIIIEGNFTQENQTTITFNLGAYLNVSGCASLSGSLIIDITNQTATQGTVTSIFYSSSSCLLGNYSAINVVGDDDECNTYTVTPTYTSTSLSVLFNVIPTGSCSPSSSQSPASPSARVAPDGSPLGEDGVLSDATTIGIAVGVSIGGLVVIIITIILLVTFVPAIRRKVRPYEQRKSEKQQAADAE